MRKNNFIFDRTLASFVTKKNSFSQKMKIKVYYSPFASFINLSTRAMRE